MAATVHEVRLAVGASPLSGLVHSAFFKETEA
jgi:hypothetical protein